MILLINAIKMPIKIEIKGDGYSPWVFTYLIYII